MSDNLYQIKDCTSNFNNFDQAMMFKMGVNDEDSFNSLLVYYRDRMHDIQGERTEWLEKLEEVKIKVEDSHKQQWELQKRRDEIAELQKSITEAKVNLFDERQQVLKLQRENDSLKIKEVEDRRKIQELLSLTEPIEETVVLQKDIRPQVTTKYVQNDLNIHSNKENFNKIVQKAGGSYSANAGRGKSVVKTIYLPNESMNSISQENECLKRQLEQERDNFNQQINTLKEELAVRDDEHKLHYNAQQLKIQELTRKLQTFEKQHLGLTKDFFSLRQKCNESEQKLHEENELLRLRNTALANKMVITQKQSEVENKVSKELIENRCEEYSNKFRNDAKKKTDSINIMKNQYTEAQKIYLGKIRELESNLSKFSEKYHKLEKQRKLEVTGFRNEIVQLNKKLERHELKQMQQDVMFDEQEEVSLTRSEKEMVEMQQMEREQRKVKQLRDKQKSGIYGNPQSTQKYKKTVKKQKKIIRQEQQPEFQQPVEAEEQEQEVNQSESLEREELDQIKNQLDNLESELNKFQA